MKQNIVTLAHPWDETKHPVKGYYMSEKLDGMRAVWDGTHLLSRNNLPIHAPQFWLDALPKNKTLDGELYLGRSNFQKVVSVCRRISPDPDDWIKIAYMVFDVNDGIGLPWIDRFRVDCAAPVIPVPHFQVHSLEQMTEFYNSIVENGGEGIMLRNPNSVYEVGRSWNLLKVKPEHRMEATVIGYEPGLGKYTGMLGALRVQAGDQIFCVGSGLTDLDRTDKYRPKIGEQVNILYSCLTDSGCPRFPRYIK